MLEQLPPDELYRLYQLLDDLAHMDAGVHLAGLILEEDEIKSVLPLIRNYYAAFFAIHEAHLAKRLLTADDPWEILERFPLYSRYEALVNGQVSALPDLVRRRLIFIGCGPVPMSLILMNRLYQTRCVGLDASIESVELARAVVETLGLDKEIAIVHGNEAALWDQDWNAVLVAALAEPKARIFQELRQMLPERGADIPVIYRTYTGMRAVLYAPVDPGHLTGFRTLREIFPTGRVNNTTVLAALEAP